MCSREEIACEPHAAGGKRVSRQGPVPLRNYILKVYGTPTLAAQERKNRACATPVDVCLRSRLNNLA
ncbi:hypothetical protein KL86DES1_20195 [uncultured Desulfovibrio sp.]|uniref:Uncharacterized protein n=1 Tax=uncultured Desulfovibrio sp. TaxID=167968 RepID=A0A212L2R4_9BACT|nr:hypothetical protein KL86DES1_20195 [uncultured Desulfovibrio sp.]